MFLVASLFYVFKKNITVFCFFCFFTFVFSFACFMTSVGVPDFVVTILRKFRFPPYYQRQRLDDSSKNNNNTTNDDDVGELFQSFSPNQQQQWICLCIISS